MDKIPFFGSLNDFVWVYRSVPPGTVFHDFCTVLYRLVPSGTVFWVTGILPCPHTEHGEVHGTDATLYTDGTGSYLSVDGTVSVHL